MLLDAKTFCSLQQNRCSKDIVREKAFIMPDSFVEEAEQPTFKISTL